MKLIAALLAITLSSTAVAGYADAVANQEFCKSAAELGRFAYEGRKEGRTKAYFYDMGASATKFERNRMIFIHAVDYGYDKGTSAKNAYMGAWGVCMDWVTQ